MKLSDLLRVFRQSKGATWHHTTLPGIIGGLPPHEIKELKEDMAGKDLPFDLEDLPRVLAQLPRGGELVAA